MCVNLFVSACSLCRFICGTQDLHKQLEKVIADFHGCEDAILYASCFDANAGVCVCMYLWCVCVSVCVDLRGGGAVHVVP